MADSKGLPPRASPSEERKFLEDRGWRDRDVLRNTVVKDGHIEHKEDALRIEQGLPRRG